MDDCDLIGWNFVKLDLGEFCPIALLILLYDWGPNSTWVRERLLSEGENKLLAVEF